MSGSVNERELLELAAIAYTSGNFFGFDDKGNALIDPVIYCPFNPLEDDGDAMRLAVDLNMSIEIDSFNGDTMVMVNDAVSSPLVIINQKHLGNPHAATRRAIVRAAAEIGRQM